MHVVQLLIPLYDNDGRAFPPSHFSALSAELTARFGGLTAYTRAPARGLWSEAGERPQRDDIVIFEVMTEELDRGWWATYRRTLEEQFEQETLVVRAQAIELL